MISACGKHAGFTLVEMIVAVGLFMLVGLLTFALFRYTTLSYERGQLGTDAQRSAREIIKRISDDLQSSMTLQYQPSLTQGASDPIPSAVLFPSSEERGQPDSVVFTAPAASQINTLDASQPGNYVLIRYAVHNHNPTTSDPNATAVLRRVYNFAEVQQFVLYGLEPNVVSPSGKTAWWYIDVTSMDTALGAPDDNTRIGGSPNDTPWQEVITLAGSYDLVTFAVLRAPLVANPQLFDPWHLQIGTTVQRYMGTPINVVSLLYDPSPLQYATWLAPPPQPGDQANDRQTRNLQTDVTLPHQ